MDAHFFDAGQWVDLEYDDVGEEEDTEAVELARNDVVTWEKKNVVLVVLEDHGLEVQRQHHDKQVAGQWGRHRTQELVSRNFT